MPKRGENIRKRKDGRWEGRFISEYTLDGTAKYKSIYGYSYFEVKEKMKQQYPIHDNKDIGYSNITMKQLCDEWLNDVKIRLKQSTYSAYYQTVSFHILTELSNIKLKGLSNNVIDKFTELKLLSELSAKTVNDIVSVLLQIIKYGEKKNYLSGFDYEVSKPTIYTKDFNILSITEQNTLASYILRNIDHENIGVLIALYTGIRLGELCALTWKDIDFESGILKISKTLQRIKNLDSEAMAKTKIIIDTPKSKKSIRDIPIPSFLIDILKDLKMNSEAYILTGEKRFIEPRTYQNKFKRYLNEAKLQDFNFHTLRHTFATRAIERGFDIKSLSEILGHSTVNFTLQRYVHPDMEHKKIHMEKMVSNF